MSVPGEQVVATAKWISILDHVKNNRIEYLLLLGVLHLVGITTKVYSQVEGVCI